MAASRKEISDWFDEGIQDKRSHMIVVCDTFDHDDYPVYADTDDDCRERYNDLNGKNMQRVMEVYDLRQDKAAQMDESRAWHLPQ